MGLFCLKKAHLTIIVIVFLKCFYPKPVSTHDTPNFNAVWYRDIIQASIPNELKNCSFFILHQNSKVDQATKAVLEVLKPHDRFLFSFNNHTTSSALRDIVDVHKFRDRCIISFIQIDSSNPSQSDILTTSTSTDHILYEFLTSIDGVIKKDEDYFIFHSLQGHNMDTLFKHGLVASHIKNKLVIRIRFHNSNKTKNSIGSDSASITLYTTCFYCSNGKPGLHIINIPHHNSKTFHLSNSPSHILFPDLLNNFHGKEFTVSTPILARWLIEIRETSPGYWMIRRGVMNSAFVHVMWKYNFTAKYFPSLGGGGTGYRFKNGTWIGTVGDVLSGRAEIGQTTGQIYNRNKVVGFSFPITYEWLTFSTGEPKPFYSWKSVYFPFAPLLWLFVIGSLAFAFFTFTFLLRATNQQKRSSFPVKEAAIYLLRSFLEQDARVLERRPRNSVRIFITFWLFFSLLITTAYRSKLVSFLAFPTVDQLPKTFESLADSNHFQIALQYLRGAAYSLIKNSNNPTFQKIFSRMELIENDAKCFQRAIEQNHFACISWDSIASFLYHKNLSDKYGNVPLIKARDTTSFIVVALTFPKRSIFKSKFDTVLVRAFDMGLVKKWISFDHEFVRNERTKWEKATNQPPVIYPHKNIIEALHIQNLSGTFYILIFGYLITIFSFIMEYLARRWKYIFKCKHQHQHQVKNIGEGAIHLLIKNVNTPYIK